MASWPADTRRRRGVPAVGRKRPGLVQRPRDSRVAARAGSRCGWQALVGRRAAGGRGELAGGSPGGRGCRSLGKRVVSGTRCTVCPAALEAEPWPPLRGSGSAMKPAAPGRAVLCALGLAFCLGCALGLRRRWVPPWAPAGPSLGRGGGGAGWTRGPSLLGAVPAERRGAWALGCVSPGASLDGQETSARRPFLPSRWVAFALTEGVVLVPEAMREPGWACAWVWMKRGCCVTRCEGRPYSPGSPKAYFPGGSGHQVKGVAERPPWGASSWAPLACGAETRLPLRWVRWVRSGEAITGRHAAPANAKAAKAGGRVGAPPPLPQVTHLLPRDTGGGTQAEQTLRAHRAGLSPHPARPRAQSLVSHCSGGDLTVP